uniref:Uncharacterized protein n=1 Tax=Gouania willdenowi TaxID=441366 RepID=A0A8C5D538_GOUWI
VVLFQEILVMLSESVWWSEHSSALNIWVISDHDTVFPPTGCSARTLKPQILHIYPLFLICESKYLLFPTTFFTTFTPPVTHTNSASLNTCPALMRRNCFISFPNYPENDFLCLAYLEFASSSHHFGHN